MAKTHAQRRAAKARRRAMRDLEQDEERHVARVAANKGEDPRKVVLDARMRLMCGMMKGHPSLPMYEHPCGRAIAARCRDLEEAVALWAIFDPMDRADAAYCRHVIGRSRYAKTAKLELMPEAFEARPDDKPDIRSDDEKHRDATETWARWRKHLSELTRAERNIIVRSLRGMTEPMRDGWVTVDGLRFLRAMRSLRNVLNAHS